jgi:hypothetical protein
MSEVVGSVDIKGEPRITAHLETQRELPIADQRHRLAEVGVERPGAVADLDRRPDREAEHVRPTAGAIRHEGDRSRDRNVGEVNDQR